MSKIEPELAEAILGLPQDEKDKLLMRLLRKEPTLLAQLRTRFFSSDRDIVAARKEIAAKMEDIFSHPRFAQVHYTPGLTMMVMRDFSGDITKHVKVSRDKEGEVFLLLKLVEMPLAKQREMLMQERRRSEKFAAYCCRKTQIALQKLEKLKPGYSAEINVLVPRVLTLLSEYPPTANLMEEYGLPRD